MKTVEQIIKEFEEGTHPDKASAAAVKLLQAVCPDIGDMTKKAEEWEAAIKETDLSMDDLLKVHYLHIRDQRLSRLKRLVALNCPQILIAREISLFKQTYDEFVTVNTCSKFIQSLRSATT